MLTTMSAAKRSKSDVRQFQESWTTDFGFVCRNDRAVCTLCCENVVCCTSSIKRHFETKHKKLFKDDSEKHEALKKAVSRYEKQSSIFKKVVRSTNQITESSYKVAECIAKRGKPFTDGDFIKEVFINCSEVLVEDLPNKNVILSKIKNLPVSARTVERRVEDMVADVKMQQAVALRCIQDVQSSTFRYFKNLQKFSCDHEVNSSVIGGYMSELKTQFCKRFQDFRRFGEVFAFLIKPDSNDDLDLSLFD